MEKNKLKQCPECGRDAPDHLRACVGCGLSKEYLRECPECNGYLGPTWREFCGWCGSPIPTTHQPASDTSHNQLNNLNHIRHSPTNLGEVDSASSATDLASSLIYAESTIKSPNVTQGPRDAAQEAFERALIESDPTRQIGLYTETIQLRPDYPDAFFRRGFAQGMLNQHQNAIEDFSEAIRLKPDDPDAFYWRGASYRFLEEHQNAIEDFSEAIRLKPDDPDAFYWRGASYHVLAEYQKAIEGFSEVIRLKPDYPEAFFMRAAGYFGLAEFPKAVEAFSEVIRLKPDDPDAFYWRGASHCALEEHRTAIKDFSEAIRLKPDYPEAFYSRGLSYNSLQEYPTAIEDFSEVIRLKPDYPKAFLQRGFGHGKLNQHQNAIEDLTEEIRLQPDDPDAFYWRGTNHFALEEHRTAIEDFSEVIRLEPDDPDAFYWRGLSYFSLKEYPTAIEDFSEVIRLKPDYSEALHLKETCYREIVKKQKPIDNIGEATRLRSHNLEHEDSSEISDTIESLNLSPRTLNALRRSGIRDTEDLTQLTESELMRIRNIGITIIDEIKTALAGQDKKLSEKESDSFDSDFDICFDPTYDHREIDRDAENLRIPLYDLIDIPEIGARGALAIMGWPELYIVDKKHADIVRRFPDGTETTLPCQCNECEITIVIDELNIVYPTKILPLIPNTLSSNRRIVTRLQGSKLISGQGNIEWEQKQLTGEHIVTTLDDISKDPSFTKELADIPVTIRDVWLPYISKSSEVQAKVSNGSSISHVGYDPEDAWNYLERGLLRRKQPKQANRLITILKARWQEGRTLEAIALTNGVTRERVRQLEGRGIERLGEFFSIVGTQGISNRLAWIESNIFDAVAHRGGYVSLDKVDDDLNWADGSLKFWFLFNSALGLLNEAPKNLRGALQLGRITFESGFLSLGERSKTQRDTEKLSVIARELIGPSGIAKLGDLLEGLDLKFGTDSDLTSDALARGISLEERGAFSLLLNPEATSQDHDIWVATGLTQAAREIARAILYGPIEDGDVSTKGLDEHLLNGVRTDLISQWLEVHSVHKPATRAIESLCNRFPDIFAETGPTSLGLIGAGAQSFTYERSVMADTIDTVKNIMNLQHIVTLSDVTKELSGKWSYAWVYRAVVLGIKKGYLINNAPDSPKPDGRFKYALDVGTDIPESEKWSKRKAKPQEHGQLIKLVITIIKDNPNGISEETVLRSVRQALPTASAESIYVYLNHGLKDIIDISSDRLYRLKEQSLRELNQDNEDSLERFTQTSLRNLDSDEFNLFHSI